jgi:hypothetical protein
MDCDSGVYGVFLDELESDRGQILFICVLLWIKVVVPVLLADSREYLMHKILFFL